MEIAPLLETLKFARARGARHIALCFWDRLPFPLNFLLRLSDLGLSALVRADGRLPNPSTKLLGLPLLSPEQALTYGPLDALIVVDEGMFAWILRCIENLTQRDLLVLPAEGGWVVPRSLVELAPEQSWRDWVPSEYAVRSGLAGHYVEFGTYWGRSFFPAYFRLRHVLKGRFYAFDSFQGLTEPKEKETLYTAGDFRRHSYSFNLKSFVALAELLGVDPMRLTTVPGLYADSLVGHDPEEYGLGHQSISVCVIDCDLYESTKLVLDFVTPLLEPGSLIYFDDWRLCRASREVGERAAALAWLKAHPSIDLVELHQTHWQHQWFIFHG